MNRAIALAKARAHAVGPCNDGCVYWYLDEQGIR